MKKRKPGECACCGKTFKNLRAHCRAVMNKLNPRRVELIRRNNLSDPAEQSLGGGADRAGRDRTEDERGDE